MHRFFFIGGPPKSGTTWVQRALDLHPGIVCSGEGHLHEFVIRPLVEMLTGYNSKLAEVAELVYEGKPYCPPLTRNEIIQLTRTVVSVLMQRRIKLTARWFGDKTPANAQSVNDLVVLFPEMKLITMLRDPRDVVASRIGQAIREGRDEAKHKDSEFYLEVVQTGALNWRLTVERARAFARQYPGQAIEVRYEDLVQDQASGLRRVLDFLEAPTSEELLAEIVQGSSFEALSGGRSPGQEDPSSFYRKGVPGDWVNHLTPAALAIVHEQCNEGMQFAGYGERGRRRHPTAIRTTRVAAERRGA